MHAIVFFFSNLWWMYAIVFPLSFMDECHSVSSIYHGSIIWKYASRFFDPSWMYASVFAWSIMDVCNSVSLIFHGCKVHFIIHVCHSFLCDLLYWRCMPWCFFDLWCMHTFMFTSSILAAWVSSWMYTIVILWRMMDVCYSNSLIYLGCNCHSIMIYDKCMA